MCYAIIGYKEEATRYKWLMKRIEVYAHKLSITFLYVYILKYSLEYVEYEHYYYDIL